MLPGTAQLRCGQSLSRPRDAQYSKHQSTSMPEYIRQFDQYHMHPKQRLSRRRMADDQATHRARCWYRAALSYAASLSTALVEPLRDVLVRRDRLPGREQPTRLIERPLRNTFRRLGWSKHLEYILHKCKALRGAPRAHNTQN